MTWGPKIAKTHSKIKGKTAVTTGRSRGKQLFSLTLVDYVRTLLANGWPWLVPGAWALRRTIIPGTISFRRAPP